MAQGALPGFRDFYPTEFAQRAYIARIWRDVARRYAFGESGGTADAELLAVAIDIMREFGLSPEVVRARDSDRRLLRALLERLGVGDEQLPAVFGIIDKIERQPREVSVEKLSALGVSSE